MIEGGSPTKWSSTGKEHTGDVCPRVVFEGMGRGNGESITTKARISRYTNVSKTNQHPAFDTYRRKEIFMHPHARGARAHPRRISHSSSAHARTSLEARVHAHRADRTQDSENSNLCKHNKYGKHAQTERLHRHGQGMEHEGTKGWGRRHQMLLSEVQLARNLLTFVS